MKVLYVSADPGIPLEGTKGAAVHVRQTVEALAAHGLKITVLTAGQASGWEAPGRVLSPAKVTKRPSGAPFRTGTLASDIDRLACGRELLQLAENEAPDVVYERYSLWSVTGAAIAEACGVPLVLEVNAPLVNEQRQDRKMQLDGLAVEIERFLMRRAEAVLCVSSELVCRARGLRGRPEGVYRFPNTVDAGRFFPVPRVVKSGGGVEIVFVGSLKPWHGLPVLIQAFASLRRAHPESVLRLVGEGPEAGKLRALAEKMNVLDAIEFTGAVEHDRVPELIRRADIAVAPYPLHDDFYFSPLKVAEYLACGTPVVASRCGDMAEQLEDGRSAFLVPPGNVPALAAALVRLADDPQLRARLGVAGRRLAVERLSLDAATTRLERLLADLAGFASAAQAEAS